MSYEFKMQGVGNRKKSRLYKRDNYANRGLKLGGFYVSIRIGV